MSSRRVDIFASPTRAWTAVCVYTILLYSTLSLVLRIYLWVFGRIGEDRVSLSLNLIFGLIGLGLVLRVRPRSPHAWVTLILVGLILAYVARLVPQPSNRIHFVEYGPLTVLVFDALKFRLQGRPRYLWSFVVIALIGVGDELIQSQVGRHFDVDDIVLNSLAAVLTLTLIGFVWETEAVDQQERPPSP